MVVTILKLKNHIMPLVKVGFVLCMHQNGLNFKVKGSKGK